MHNLKGVTMKKMLITFLLLILTMPAYAGFWDTPQDQFNKLEAQVRQEAYSNLKAKIEDYWNLKGENFANEELQKQINENNVKIFPDTFIVDKKGIEEYHENFLKNKNNMSQNRALYESLNKDFINIYLELKKLFTENIYKNEFYNYQETLYKKNKNISVNAVYIDYHKYNYIYDCKDTDSTTGLKLYKLRGAYIDRGVNVINDWRQFKVGFLAQEQPTLKNILNIVDENIKNAQKVQDEIKNYSIAYETKKLENFYKSKYGNVKNCGDISNVILKGTSPQMGCYYDTDTLEVLQVINGGILARDYDWNSNRIFIVTNKKVVDGDAYSGRLLYKGIYKYTSIMGAPVTVRKFQEIPLPQENFYFIYK